MRTTLGGTLMRKLMWTASAALLLAVLLTGCSASDAPVQPRDSASPLPVSPSAANDGLAALLAELPSAPLDVAGRPASEAVLELIAARNAADWERVYSLYADPEGELETLAREWAGADECYRDFTVHEARAFDETTALVRVTYVVEATPPGGPRRESVIASPGEWWAVELVDGLWKVQWLPRQW
jgi:hypothetical protein